jgi:prepilin-type N-terminal cleavage/methylation domain-containing protein
MNATVFRIPNSKGFTFIELLIAMSILAIGMLAAVTMQFGSVRNNTKGNIYTEANMLAKSQLENLKNQDITTLASGGGTIQDPNNPINAEGVAGGIYTRTWTIDDLGTTARRITVTVQWIHRGKPGSVIVSSNTKGGGV